MAIEFQETFQVSAPIDSAWQFMMTPDNIVACMPGASLAEIIDENKFVGNVKLKIGAVSASYQGTITYTEIDKEAHSVVMLAEGKEKGGGTVSGTITARLSTLPNGDTEVSCSSSIDLTGRIMQVGRGMIQGVSQQIIKKFVTNAKGMLEQNTTAGQSQDIETNEAHGTNTPKPASEDAINVVAVVWNVIWDSLRRFFSQLFGKAK